MLYKLAIIFINKGLNNQLIKTVLSYKKNYDIRNSLTKLGNQTRN